MMHATSDVVGDVLGMVVVVVVVVLLLLLQINLQYRTARYRRFNGWEFHSIRDANFGSSFSGSYHL